MKAHIIHDDFIIWQEKTLFRIEFKTNSQTIIRSLIKTNLIQSGLSNDKYTIIRFKANTIKTLHEYQDEYKQTHGKRTLLISDAAKMIRSLTKQLTYMLDHERCTILGYSPSNILVINDEIFVYLGGEMITDIDIDTRNLLISFPFTPKDFFLSPELLRIKEIPQNVHYKTTYFSLAILIIYALIGNEFYDEYVETKSPETILAHLQSHHVKNTKIYWLLSRCLEEEPKNRSIILI